MFHSNLINVPEEYDDYNAAGKIHYLLLYSDSEGDQIKTSARKLYEKVMYTIASKPQSTHMIVFGELQPNKIGNTLKEESLIKGSYVSNSMHVHRITLCYHGKRTYRKLQTMSNKYVCESSKK